jgi:hypothetical protein
MIRRGLASRDTALSAVLAGLIVSASAIPAHGQPAVTTARLKLAAASIPTDSLTKPQPPTARQIWPSSRLQAGGAAAQETPKRNWMREHPVAFWGLIGTAAGFGIGYHSNATYDCPQGRSCSTAPVVIPFATMLGYGVGSVVGLAIEHWP